MHIGGLEGSLEDCDGVVLSCDIIEILWSTRDIRMACSFRDFGGIYYFSTHGCNPVVSFAGTALAAPFIAAASFRALRSKNPAMITRFCMCVEGHNERLR